MLPKEHKSYRKGYYKNHRILGRPGIDQRTFLNNIKPRVLNFFNQQKQLIKVDQILRINFVRDNIKDGNNEFAVKDFHTHMMEVHAGHYNSEDYEKVKENLLEQVDTLLENGSQWIFDRVESYDINSTRPHSKDSRVEVMSSCQMSYDIRKHSRILKTMTTNVSKRQSLK